MAAGRAVGPVGRVIIAFWFFLFLGLLWDEGLWIVVAIVIGLVWLGRNRTGARR